MQPCKCHVIPRGVDAREIHVFSACSSAPHVDGESTDSVGGPATHLFVLCSPETTTSPCMPEPQPPPEEQRSEELIDQTPGDESIMEIPWTPCMDHGFGIYPYHHAGLHLDGGGFEDNIESLFEGSEANEGTDGGGGDDDDEARDGGNADISVATQAEEVGEMASCQMNSVSYASPISICS
ncbi:hypothetical protein B296_00044972 [Ensete ventricosum]|uniref:Uncharacterized protein n=1 Tax=Ensete ventricosum TaxID=4639 RepID=A0A426X3B4_ENSVE|nr:hypothetical protein B296_00044972 [Ensete ventricosum]